MLAQTVTLDKQGRIVLPPDVRDALGVGPNDTLILRMVDKKLVIEAASDLGPITSAIAAMDLPIADWETLEQQIERGRLA